jgi:O-acetyl-ADP-ribose deacetylase (regulator of RNase III)
MPVNIIQGDLLSASENIIGHQVNCQAVMGSGVARALRDKYSGLYSAYTEFCTGNSPKELLGQLQIVPVAKDKYVANLLGQLNFGRSNITYTNYNALKAALLTLKEFAKENGYTVALPYNIGCGLANGKWSIVEPMIQEVFADYEVTLYKI